MYFYASRLFLLTTLITSLVWGDSLTTLTSQENDEVSARLKHFYSGDPAAMNENGKKFSLSKQAFVHPHPELKYPGSERLTLSNLETQAQRKNEPGFRKAVCEKVLKKVNPQINCDSEDRSSLEKNDRVENLSRSWMQRVTYDLDEIPVRGRSNLPLWSDDYWRTRWGLTSYRYSTGTEFPTYKEAIASYRQPLEWTGLATLSPEKVAETIVAWSPSEKYDISVGDAKFSLTRQQKEEGKSQVGADGNVEDWMGICHGWAPASIMVQRPLKSVKVVGNRGVEVEWYPNDIKAMATLAWANGEYRSNFIGGRCNSKKPKLYPNGRLSEQVCFDNNPASFHLALGNMVGIGKNSFVMDKTFDYEVWNQPIVGYEFTYYNPLDHSRTDADWKKVAVSYDDTFKKQDRFQKPLTRGQNGGPTPHPGVKRADEHIQMIVGVRATVIYVSEITPEHSPEPQEDELLRDIYLYDLELTQEEGKWIVTGGEWLQNNHPDFLFVPRKDTVLSSSFDELAPHYSGSGDIDPMFTKVAAQASGTAYPLCSVLKALVGESSGQDLIQCAQ